MESNARPIKIAAMGDAMLTRTVGARFAESPSDFAFNDFRKLFRDCDIVFLNLENPVSRNGTPHPIQKANVTFCAAPPTLQILKNMGVNVVSIANNHLLDYGPEALEATRENLRAYQIKFCGAGRNRREANQPAIIKVRDHKVAILSHVFVYSASTLKATRRRAGVADQRINPILKQIRTLKRQGCLVLVSLHWGIEYGFYPVPYQRRQAKRMIEAGASLIIGHGPHYPQGIENYRHGQIIYSLGNLFFDEPYEFANKSFIYTGRIDPMRGVTDHKIFPYHIRDGLPELVEGNQAKEITSLVAKLSEEYAQKNTDFWKRISARYFSDIVWRVSTMKSLKFVFLPPLSFYLTLGVKNYWKKLLSLVNPPVEK